MPDPIRLGAAGVDLSERFFRSGTVVASPATDAEIVVAQLNITPDLAVQEGVMLWFWGTLTVGADGEASLTRIRRDSLTGTAIKASGLTAQLSSQLVDVAINGFDATPTLPNEVYVVTMVVTAASTASTISALEFAALVI